MNRKYIIIGFAAVAVVLLVVGFIIARTGGNGGEPAVSGEGGEEINEFESAGNTAIDAPEGETFMLPAPGVSVRVKNFYRSAVRVVEDIEVVIAETPDYRISYIRPFTLFIVNVWGERPGQTRFAAERALLTALNVSEQSACRLSVEVWLSPVPGLADGGKSLPLSFCEE